MKKGARVIGIVVSLIIAFSIIPLVSDEGMGANPPVFLDPKTIPKWENELTGPPPVYVPTNVMADGAVVRQDYTIDMTQFQQQILPPSLNLMTTVWGYGGEAKDALSGESLGYIRNSPGPTFEATRGIPSQVTWQNKISDPHMFAVDPTLHWADPNGMGTPMPPFEPYPPGYPEAQSPVPLIPHLHGAEVQSTSDGYPEAWFTYDGKTGMAYNSLGTNLSEAVFYYPNEQPPTTLWYHDHGLGITRINVMSGLAGFYLLRDPADTVEPLLPGGKYEMPIVIQDRTFLANGEFWFPEVGLDPAVHPYWEPEFFGDTIMVNGKVWPFMNVDQGWYRFRFLDGSNARFYTLTFKVLSDLDVMPLPFWVIGSDGGYLKTPAPVSSFTIAPGERVDVLIDFSNVPAGTKILLNNNAKTPFPNGASANPQTVGQIMQFVVTANAGHENGVNLINNLPATLNPYLTGAAFPTLPAADVTKARTLVLWEVMGALGPTEILLNGQKWMADISENPSVGATEEWIIVNPTMDTHPIHLHLVQFQLVSRQKIDTNKYTADWLAAQTDPGMMNDWMPPWTMHYIPNELAIGNYLKGKASPALPAEQGWKDTVQMNPGEVSIIRVKFAPIDGSATYPFDPTVGPGYVWHCHILDHEDNEMMRPYIVI